MRYIFEPEAPVAVPVAGQEEHFPVRRVYCVGQNYADHAREMGSDPQRQPPCFFTKPANAVVPGGGDIPYPPRTDNLPHEVELVVAMGARGSHVPVAEAPRFVYAYGVGVDLTRRDLQVAAKKAGLPWDVGKAFDHSAPLSPLHRVADIGSRNQGRIWLDVNGELRQQADIADMTWNVDEIISELSGLFELQPGDLVFTGTPAGVGALQPGDRVRCGVDGVDELHITIAAG